MSLDLCILCLDEHAIGTECPLIGPPKKQRVEPAEEQNPQENEEEPAEEDTPTKRRRGAPRTEEYDEERRQEHLHRAMRECLLKISRNRGLPGRGGDELSATIYRGIFQVLEGPGRKELDDKIDNGEFDTDPIAFKTAILLILDSVIADEVVRAAVVRRLDRLVDSCIERDSDLGYAWGPSERPVIELLPEEPLPDPSERAYFVPTKPLEESRSPENQPREWDRSSLDLKLYFDLDKDEPDWELAMQFLYTPLPALETPRRRRACRHELTLISPTDLREQFYSEYHVEEGKIVNRLGVVNMDEGQRWKEEWLDSTIGFITIPKRWKNVQYWREREEKTGRFVFFVKREILSMFYEPAKNRMRQEKFLNSITSASSERISDIFKRWCKGGFATTIPGDFWKQYNSKDTDPADRMRRLAVLNTLAACARFNVPYGSNAPWGDFLGELYDWFVDSKSEVAGVGQVQLDIPAAEKLLPEFPGWIVQRSLQAYTGDVVELLQDQYAVCFESEARFKLAKDEPIVSRAWAALLAAFVVLDMPLLDERHKKLNPTLLHYWDSFGVVKGIKKLFKKTLEFKRAELMVWFEHYAKETPRFLEDRVNYVWLLMLMTRLTGAINRHRILTLLQFPMDNLVVASPLIQTLQGPETYGKLPQLIMLDPRDPSERLADFAMIPVCRGGDTTEEWSLKYGKAKGSVRTLVESYLSSLGLNDEIAFGPAFRRIFERKFLETVWRPTNEMLLVHDPGLLLPHYEFRLLMEAMYAGVPMRSEAFKGLVDFDVESDGRCRPFKDEKAVVEEIVEEVLVAEEETKKDILIRDVGLLISPASRRRILDAFAAWRLDTTSDDVIVRRMTQRRDQVKNIAESARENGIEPSELPDWQLLTKTYFHLPLKDELIWLFKRNESPLAGMIAKATEEQLSREMIIKQSEGLEKRMRYEKDTGPGSLSAKTMSARREVWEGFVERLREAFDQNTAAQLENIPFPEILYYWRRRQWLRQRILAFVGVKIRNEDLSRLWSGLDFEQIDDDLHTGVTPAEAPHRPTPKPSPIPLPKERGTVLLIEPEPVVPKISPPKRPIPSPNPTPQLEPKRSSREREIEEQIVVLEKIYERTHHAIRYNDWETAADLKQDAEKLRADLRAAGRLTLPQNADDEEEIERHFARQSLISEDEKKELLIHIADLEADALRLMRAGKDIEAAVLRESANEIRAQLARDRITMPPPPDWEAAQRLRDEAYVATLLKDLVVTESMALRLEEEGKRSLALVHWKIAYQLRYQLLGKYELSIDQLPPNPRPSYRKPTGDPVKEKLMDRVEHHERKARDYESEGDIETARIMWGLAADEREELRLLGVLDYDQPVKAPELPPNMNSETRANAANERAIEEFEKRLKESRPLDTNGPIPAHLTQAAEDYRKAARNAEKAIEHEISLTKRIEEIELSVDPSEEEKTRLGILLRKREQVRETIQNIERRRRGALDYLTKNNAQRLVLSKELLEEEEEFIDILRKTGKFT
jgi:hypothetical protein